MLAVDIIATCISGLVTILFMVMALVDPGDDLSTPGRVILGLVTLVVETLLVLSIWT